MIIFCCYITEYYYYYYYDFFFFIVFANFLLPFLFFIIFLINFLHSEFLFAYVINFVAINRFPWSAPNQAVQILQHIVQCRQLNLLWICNILYGRPTDQLTFLLLSWLAGHAQQICKLLTFTFLWLGPQRDLRL